MRTCKVCHTPIEHTNGNRETCFACEPKNRKRIPTDSQILISVKDFTRLNRQAAIGAKIEKLNGAAKETVLALLEQMLKG